MLFSEIVSVTNATLLGASSDESISSLAFDTRKLVSKKQVLFMAISGPSRDGHLFIDQAFALGVRHFLVSKKQDLSKYPKASFALVEDVITALQQIAQHHRSQFDIPIVGITGSNAKTIVKEWLAEVLNQQYRIVKSPKSYNSQMGVPLSVWAISAHHDLGIFEAGISRTKEMASLEQVIKPTVGIFTNIGNAHDEGFPSIKSKIEEKAILFQHADTVICSKDQTNLYPILKELFGEKLFTWSLKDKKCDVAFELRKGQLSATYQTKTFHFSLYQSSSHFVENLLQVIATALYFGLSEAAINAGLKRIRPVAMRLELKRGIKDCYILDDSYNNDLAGLSIALDYLKQQPHQNRKTVILSDIQQSGIAPEELYQRVNDLLIANDVSRLIAVGEQMKKHANLFSVPSHFYPSVKELISEWPLFEEELILVKGARSFGMERVVSLLEEKSHGTVLEVNFEALTHNLKTYQNLLSPGTKMMVMVKAFAYGGGLGEIAHLLQYEKVDYLGVAYTDEGAALRQKGITLPIMVMNADTSHFDLLEAFDLQPEIYSSDMLMRYVECCETPPPIHIKIETGMNRLGFRPDELDELLQLLASNPQLKVAGVFTHFSSSEDETEDEYTIWQANQLEIAFDKIEKHLTYKPLKYAVNSAGIVRWPQYHFDMVRLGIGLYGYDSSSSLADLKPVSTLKAHVSQVRSIKKGESIGYSRMGQAEQDGQIAVVSIGYADGYLRTFGRGKAYMCVNGKLAQTVGNICMDMTILDVTGLEVKDGDEVIVFGQNPTIQDLAKWADTIPYEILTNVSQRVKRVFVSE